MKSKKIIAGLILSATLLTANTSAFAAKESQAMWKKNNTGWWYEEKDGSYPYNDWKEVNGKWYYFDSRGYCVMNTWIGNYYLGKDGAMLVNTTTPDGYKVDKNGKWIEERKATQNNDKSNNKYHNTERYKSLIAQGFTEKEAELAERINEYRRELGLREFSISKSLTTVARTHVIDCNTYHPENQKDERGIQGNGHSWSNHGSWKPVVYTPDHKYAELMWSKPSELTSYKGSGYEIGHIAANVSPKEALAGWKSSTPHHNIIIGKGSTWSELTVMGVGINGKYSFIWFGVEEDPAGYYWKNQN